MLNLRTLAVLTALGILTIGLGSSTGRQHFNSRWNAALNDIHNHEAPIPHEKLHARALEILRDMTMARSEACASFNHSERGDVTCD